MSSRDTATAYEAWQKQWSTVEGRARWVEPDPDVMAVVDRWQGAASTIVFARPRMRSRYHVTT